MGASNEISEDILPVVLDDDIGQLDSPQEGKVSRCQGDGTVGDPEVNLGDDVEAAEGDGLQLAAVAGDGHQVLGGYDGLVGTLHVQPRDTAATGLQELPEAEEAGAGLGVDQGDLVEGVAQRLEGGAQLCQGLSHEQFEGSQLGTDFQHLT